MGLDGMKSVAEPVTIGSSTRALMSIRVALVGNARVREDVLRSFRRLRLGFLELLHEATMRLLAVLTLGVSLWSGLPLLSLSHGTCLRGT